MTILKSKPLRNDCHISLHYLTLATLVQPKNKFLFV